MKNTYLQTVEAKVEVWQALLAEAYLQGFICQGRGGSVFQEHAEFYKWNQWTVHFQIADSFTLDQIRVELCFDSEALEYRNRVMLFPFDEGTKALETAARWVRVLNGGEVLAEAFQDN